MVKLRRAGEPSRSARAKYLYFKLFFLIFCITMPISNRTRWPGLLVPAILLTFSRASAQPAAPSPQSAASPQATPSPQVDEEARAPGAAAPADPAPVAGGEAAPSQPVPPAEAAPLEVSVVGTRVAQTAGSAHVINNRKLERFEYDDPHAVLNSVPGVYARGEDGLGLRPNIGIRGVDPDRSKKVTLMEDGILIAPAPYSAPAAYYFPVMTRLQGVRIIKGPGAVSYGPQTVGGAIDLVTRPVPSTFSGGLDLSVGEYMYGKAHGYVGASDGQTDFLIEGIHLRTDGFKELPDGADTGFHRNEWMIKGSHVIDPTAKVRHELRVKLTYSDEVSNETYLGLSDADFEANPLRRYGASQLDRMRNHRTAVALTHVFTPLPNLSVETSVYRNDFSRVWRKVNAFRGASLFDVLRDPESSRYAGYYEVISGRSDSTDESRLDTLLIGPNEREFAAHGVQTRVRWDTSTGPVSHRVEYGLRLHYDRVERRHSENGYLVLGGQLVPDGTPTIVTAFEEAWTDAIALHAVDAITWKGLTLTPGIRVEVISSALVDKRPGGTEKKHVSYAVLPGIGAFYAITDTLGILAGAYRGFSPPAPGSGKEVEPELSVNYEAGARFADRRLRAELIGYYNDYTNLTSNCTQSTGCDSEDVGLQFHAGSARIYGLEAFAEHEIPIGSLKLPVSLAYTLAFTEFREDFSSTNPAWGEVARGDEIPYVPRHQLGASIGVESERLSGVVGVSYMSAMREEAGSEPLSEVLATDEQLVIDAGVKGRPLKSLEVYANVRNLLNSHAIVSHRPYGARPNAPRWVQVGAKVSF